MPQFARPDADLSRTNTVNQSSVTTNLFATIGEAVRDDSDFIRNSATSAQVATLRVSLNDVLDPQSSLGHIIRYARGCNSTAGMPKIKIDLYQGATLIASTGTVNITATAFETATYTLTAAEADAITNYSALEVLITLTAGSSIGGGVARCSWLEFEVPDAGGGRARRRIFNT